jgi:hypothetical protein
VSAAEHVTQRGGDRVNAPDPASGRANVLGIAVNADVTVEIRALGPPDDADDRRPRRLAAILGEAVPAHRLQHVTPETRLRITVHETQPSFEGKPRAASLWATV